MEIDADRNRRRYQALLEEQYRIAYVSQGAMSFHDAECLSSEDRATLVDVITKIKKQEKDEIEKSTRSSSMPSRPAKLPSSKPSKYSSLNSAKAPSSIPRR